MRIISYRTLQHLTVFITMSEEPAFFHAPIFETLENNKVFTRFDFFTSLPLTNHSSSGLGMDVYCTSIVTSSPFLTLYSFWRTSIFILGAVSITKSKQNTNLLWCCSCYSQVTIYSNNNYYIRPQNVWKIVIHARQWNSVFHSVRLTPHSHILNRGVRWR